MSYTRDAVALLIFIATSMVLSGVPAWILLVGAQVVRASLNKSKPDDTAKPTLAFWKKLLLGMLGGAIGEVVAVSVCGPAISSWCRDLSAQGYNCDGQGSLILVFTIPLCAVLGSSLSTIWTWYSLRIPAERAYGSVFRYRGVKRALNVAVAIAIQAVYWSLFAFAAYQLTLGMLDN
ncbi:MAG: hypothetical protein P4L40_21140 [Terracidiphilus sp.]|nr:hypothetical protein [Terracidiphilus sp.]